MSAAKQLQDSVEKQRELLDAVMAECKGLPPDAVEAVRYALWCLMDGLVSVELALEGDES